MSQISAEKKKFLTEILGESEAEKMLDGLTRLETDLKARGVDFKESKGVRIGDILFDLLASVEAGQTTIQEVKEVLGDPVAAALERQMGGLLQRSKDVPHSLGSKATDGITVGDVLMELVQRVENGRMTLVQIRKGMGDVIEAAVQRIVGERGKVAGGKDTASLEDIRANIAKARELVDKLDADAQATGAQKDTSPVARYARMLTGKKEGKSTLIDETDTSPIARHVKALAEGRVEGG